MKPSSQFRFLAFLLVVLTFSIPFVPLAQENSTATADAIADAERDMNKTSWFMAGCFLNIIGVAAAQMRTPSVPAERLIGKSPEYVAVYTVRYQERLSKLQMNYALSGCALGSVGCIVVTTYYVIEGCLSSTSGGSSWCGGIF